MSIVFLGDSEFRAVGLQRYCRARKWHWHLGVTSDTLFRRSTGPWPPLRTLQVTRGERRYVHQLTLTRQHAFPNVHLMIDWTHAWNTPPAQGV